MRRPPPRRAEPPIGRAARRQRPRAQRLESVRRGVARGSLVAQPLTCPAQPLVDAIVVEVRHPATSSPRRRSCRASVSRARGEVRLHGPFGAPEHGGRVGHGAILDVEQHDRPALLLGQRPDALPQLVVTARQLEHDVAAAEARQRRSFPSLAAPGVGRGVQRDSAHPRARAVVGRDCGPNRAAPWRMTPGPGPRPDHGHRSGPGARVPNAGTRRGRSRRTSTCRHRRRRSSSLTPRNSTPG